VVTCLKCCRPEQKARVLSRRNPVSSRVPLSNRSKRTAVRKRASSAAEIKSDARDPMNVSLVDNCCWIDSDHEEVLDGSMSQSKQGPSDSIVVASKNMRKTDDKLQSSTAVPPKDTTGNVYDGELASKTVTTMWQNAFISFMSSSVNVKDAVPVDDCCDDSDVAEDALLKRRSPRC
jgi:hypothetical protein